MVQKHLNIFYPNPTLLSHPLCLFLATLKSLPFGKMSARRHNMLMPCGPCLQYICHSRRHGLQLIPNATVRIFVNLPRSSPDRITPKGIELHFSPVKVRSEFRLCLLANKSFLSGESGYIKNLLKKFLI